MKENFLNKKNKAVLRAICEILKIGGCEKISKPKIIKMLKEKSFESIKKAYSETSYGINRQRIDNALEAYPSDQAAIDNLQNMNDLKL